MRWGWLLFSLAACGGITADPGDAGDAGAAPACTQVTPQLLAQTTDPDGSMLGLVLHGSNLLWVESESGGSTLRMMAKDGGTVTNLGACDRFGIDGEVAFCSVASPNAATLWRVPLDGSAATKVAPLSPPVATVLAGGGSVYVAGLASLSSVDESTGASTTLSSGAGIDLLALEGGVLYWSANTGTTVTPTSTLNATSVQTGMTTALASQSAFIYFMAKNSKSIFFSGYSPQDQTTWPDTIYEMPVAGGDVQVFASNMAETPFAVDETTLVAWPSQKSAAAYSLAGGEPKPLSTDVNGAEIAIDDAFVYWLIRDEHYAMLYRVCR